MAHIQSNKSSIEITPELTEKQIDRIRTHITELDEAHTRTSISTLRFGPNINIKDMSHERI